MSRCLPQAANDEVCEQIAKIIAGRLETDVVRVKIKSLDLIMQMLTRSSTVSTVSTPES